MSTTMYTFDLRTGALTGSRPAQVVGGKELTICAGATPVAPPTDIPTGHAACWTGSAWEVVEDHRQHMDSKGTKIGGTPYWQPAEGDDWQSPPRYTEELGPLPDGAVTERPEKPAPTRQEIDSVREVEIKAELQSIDAQSGRPARAVALASVKGGAPDPEDVAKLEELEAQAQALREELRQIAARLEAQAAKEDRMI